MACACTFGVGSHFASHIIGPLKGILMEQLDLTNTQFSLLVASFTLCNTVIPIVSGLLVARFGTTTSSLVTDVERLIKISAMACACTFGVGSHFASHIIGPLKGILMEQLDLTNTQFSLLVASFTLCNTVIPIVSGLLVARFGTTTSSLVTTTIILIGMIIVTVASWTDRFLQIKPKILLSVNAVIYNNKTHDHLSKLRKVVESLVEEKQGGGCLEKVIIIPFVTDSSSTTSDDSDISSIPLAISWNDFLNTCEDPLLKKKDLIFEQLPFDHPLYILFSSDKLKVSRSKSLVVYECHRKLAK
ncbi:9908_t:CDS:2, partial [Entrophospora sp. SA101]